MRLTIWHRLMRRDSHPPHNLHTNMNRHSCDRRDTTSKGPLPSPPVPIQTNLVGEYSGLMDSCEEVILQSCIVHAIERAICIQLRPLESLMACQWLRPLMSLTVVYCNPMIRQQWCRLEIKCDDNGFQQPQIECSAVVMPTVHGYTAC